jgi:hypothetical protein
MPAGDILLGEDFEPVIVNGDFSVGNATNQHQKLLILCTKGDFKLNPTAGVDVTSHLDDDNFNLLQEASRVFSEDGMKVNNIGYQPNGTLRIDSTY